MYGRWHASPNDWLMNTQIFDLALTALMKEVKIDRTKHVPYVAGYSLDGRTIYIDSRMPEGFEHAGQFIKTDKYLVLHEVIEKLLEIRYPRMPYQFCHQLALRLERDAVINDRIPWTIYNKFMMDWVKKIGNSPVTTPPHDLDTKPERDEHDAKTLKQLRAHGDTA